MYIYFFAGVFLLVAIIFIIKFFIGLNRSKKIVSSTASDNNGLTIIADDAKPDKPAKKNHIKRDVIIAMVFMLLCEVCILLGNYVIEI